MHSFTTDSRTWLVRLDVGGVRLVRALAGVDLHKDDPVEVFSDALKVALIAWALCYGQCEARGMDRGAFLRSLHGDALQEAQEALIGELQGYWPEAKESDPKPQPGEPVDVDEVIDAMGGLLGIDPAPFTLRSLIRMVEKRREEAWEHTAWLACAVNNSFGGKMTLEQCNPYRKPGHKPPAVPRLDPKASMDFLNALLDGK